MGTYILKKTSSLGEIDDIDPDSALKTVFHAEHEPLQLTTSIRIISHPAIINLWLLAADLLNVSTFKTGVESHRFKRLVEPVRHFCGYPIKFLQVYAFEKVALATFLTVEGVRR